MIARIAPLGKTLIKDGKEVVARYFDIRKLAPQECLRLMGVREDDVQKIMECGISNSAVYKCAGNSISEIDPAPIQAYMAVHGDVKNYGDIGKIWWDNVPDFDLFTYSFPCFAAGTKITTNNGDVAIEKINVGDMVLTSEGYKKVVKTFDNGKKNTFDTKMEYEFQGKLHQVRFEVTPNHKFKTPKGWVEFQNLIVGDTIFALHDGKCVEVTISLLHKLGRLSNVYDIEVEDAHEFYAEGILVHNCTDISSAGKQMGLSEGSGSRSSLLWECRNAIKIKRPKYCLMENVKALTQDKFIGEFQKWQMEMESMGYANFTQVLNAKDYGVAQNRERVFMLSILKTPEDPEPQYHFPQGFKLTKSIRDYLDENFDPRLLLKPENVIKFLKDNNNDDSIYVVTDRKFTDEELDEIRHSTQSEDRGGKGD